MWIKKRMYIELKKNQPSSKKNTQGRPLELMKDKAANAKSNAAPSTLR